MRSRAGAPVRNPKDFWAGMLFLAVGASAASVVLLSGYELGSARKMGPGYFPIWIAGGLMFTGLMLAGKALVTDGPRLENWALKPLLLVTLGVLLFAVIVNIAGLLPAIFLLVLISAFASVRFHLKWALPLALGLAVMSVLIFVKGLGLAVPIMPQLIGY